MPGEKSLPAHFGRYQVLEELGHGAMGVVYLCVDARLARPVAIKVVKDVEHRSSEERELYFQRFRREAEAAGRLNHPDIVQIFDVGPDYLVMEFVEGQSLAEALRAGERFPVKRAAPLILRIADALDYAHEHGVVHRDVKPANVMLTSDGGVKVMDFGVARLEKSNLTVAGAVVGSVRYMAPEQMMGEPVDGRADVFSLAAVAYELLAGRSPFPGRTVTEVVTMVVGGHHVPPRQVDSRIPESLDGVFARGFAPRPDRRYARGMDFAREFYDGAQPILELELRGAAAETSPTEADGSAVRVEATRVDRAREGVLVLGSEPPGAAVSVDGSPVGVAPVSAVEVSFGRHVIRMEVEGRQPVSAEIELSREQPLRAVSFTLPPPRPQDSVLRPGQFVPFGPEVTPPRLVSGAPPVYPDTARERGIEGSPVVEIWIGETGDVVDVAILTSAGALLDGALLQAVAGWRFTPATIRGTPVSVRMTIQHLFRR